MGEADMQQDRVTRPFWLAASLLSLLLVGQVMLRATAVPRGSVQEATGTGRFTGRVVSASGAVVVGGAATNPGHPVAGATIHLVPVTAIDVTTPMTASAIYAPPYPAETYDEPLEDTIRLPGSGFPRATTDGEGKFEKPNGADGRFFNQVTADAKDAEQLPGGDHSRESYSAEQLRGHSMTIKLSSSPSPAARYTGSSSCLSCHKDKEHWNQTAHKLGWTVPEAPGRMQDFSRHPNLLAPLEYFPNVDDYTRGTRLELGDYDATRGDD